MAISNGGEDTPTSARETGFRASLQGAALADLVQMECLAGRQRVIRVTSGRDVGYLFFRGGQIVHAVSRRHLGDAAALEILRWNEGSFEACSAAWPDRDSVTSNWQNLLLLAAQQRDEAGQVELPSQREESGRRKLVALPGARTQATRGGSAGPPASATVVTQREAAADAAQLIAAVRLDGSGNVVAARGEAEALAQIAAYAARLAELVGEQLGMPGLTSVEVAQSQSRTLIVREKTGNILALTASTDGDLAQIRERLRI